MMQGIALPRGCRMLIDACHPMVRPHLGLQATELQVARAEFAERERVVRQSHGALAGAKAELKEMSTKLTDRRHMLWQAQSMVTVRQTRIILELSQIFPLLQAEGPNGNLSICNLTLPNSDYAGCDEEAVSTALGERSERWHRPALLPPDAAA